MQRASTSLFSTLPLAIVSCLVSFTAKAQIVPDDSLGAESSVVVPFDEQGVDVINGGAARGANLFHSFQEFNVNPDRGAFFGNPEGINNIFSRVTGTNISNINGQLGVLGGANLFLINPNGIIFGENAALNIQGSFFASSADGLLFDNNFEFSANNRGAPPLLEINIPIGLNFRDNPGNIINQSSGFDADGNPVGLQVSAGQTLTLAGGNIDLIGGNLTARGGNIELGAVADAATVNINENSSLNFADTIARGDITLSEGSQVAVSPLIEGNAGNINLTAREIALSGLSVLEASSFVAGDGDAGNIVFNATDNISLTNSVIISNIGAETTGSVGEIILQADSILITEGSQLQAGLFAGGQSNETIGQVLLQADNFITLDSATIFANNESETIGDTVDIELLANSISIGNSTLLTTNDGQGNAGNIEITVNEISLDNSNLFANNNGLGNAGNVNINAANGAISFTGSSIFTNSTTIQSGNIDLSAGSLLLADNSNLGGFATGSSGAGNVTIETNEFVTLDGGSSISVLSSGTGAGGNVAINTTRLNILSESGINAFVFGDLAAGSIAIDTSESVTIGTESTILLNTSGSGNAGSLELNAGSLNVTGGAQISSATFAGGEGGNLNINADRIEIIGIAADGITPSRIDASTSGSGAGGDIQINANNLTIRDGAGISAFADLNSTGNGGNITINATESVNIAGFNPLSLFSSSIDTATGNVGNAGNINLNTANLKLSNGAQIDSSTSGQGNAGNIDVTAADSLIVSGFIPSSRIGSRITSQSASIFNQPVGNAGNITVFTPNLFVRDAGQITVGGFGTSSAGNLFIDADVIKLDNFGILNAQTFGGEGNINLIGEDIILRGESNITTNAFGSSPGGNIAIDTENLIAFPNENSDISANAQNSFGGRVEIAAKGIFGTEFREISTLQSDITATSQLGAEFDGEVSLNTPDFDPTTGLINLPASVGDASDQISQNPCQQGVGSEFIVTGKGGLPPTVNEALNGEEVQVGLIEPLPQPLSYEERGERQGEGRTVGRSDISLNSSNTPELLPAMGWIFNDRGEVTLTAYSTLNNKAQRPRQQNQNSCSSGIDR